jgi:hypothetical protein
VSDFAQPGDIAPAEPFSQPTTSAAPRGVYAVTENPRVAALRLDAVRAASASTERSMQRRVGMSEIGGAACQLGHRLLGTPTTNHDTQVLAAARGTAIHKWLEDVLPVHAHDGDKMTTEAEVEFGPLLGHTDIILVDGVIEDSKTKDGVGMMNVRRYGPGRDYVWQNHLYAAAVMAAGGPPIHTLRWTFYTVSTPDDVYVVEMPYDPVILTEALEHYNRVLADASAGVKPEPERNVKSWCKPFCSFYDPTDEVGCAGMPPREKGTLPAEHPFEDDAERQRILAAVIEYDAAREDEKDIARRRAAARSALEGYQGRVGDFLLDWSPTNGRIMVSRITD